MIHATEYFQVQSALGFEDKSPLSTSAKFAAYDEQYADRIIDKSADLNGMKIRGIFVDNNLILVLANNQPVQADETKLRNLLNI